MCGIAGMWSPDGCGRDEALAAARTMATALAHRGPDDCGVWCDDRAALALGHRRLSIVDLSPQGHQPMTSADGRWTTVFNGEIYNHRELRAELETAGGESWRGTSDTEVLLASVVRWGVDATLARLVGMFSLALWDARERHLFLARDRMGEKPLYYGRAGSAFLFGSELKALAAHPQWHGEVDTDAVALYLRYGYVPEPYSIYRDIRKLQPGTSVCICEDEARGQEPIARAYWSAATEARRAWADRFAGTREEALDELDRLLRRSIAGQIVADVPVGALLSGGIDSSLIVALMQAQSARRVRTFTIGFTEDGFDEAGYARDVAAHLGTDHTELYVSPQAALDVISTLPRVYDEPFGDSSQIPTILVSGMAREHVTVCLSGDGGDELFGGYRRYAHAEKQWQRLEKIPYSLRCALARMIPASSDRLEKLSQVLGARDRLSLHARLVSVCRDSERLVPRARELQTALTRREAWLSSADYREAMMWLDTVSYLPGDILTKVDRAAMSVSLETRVPLLDHRVVEFSWRLPAEVKCADGVGKWPLRALLERHVPKRLIERPKAGFSVPIHRWLRHELREWADDLLSPNSVRRSGYLDEAVVTSRWRSHLEGRSDQRHWLWNVLMLQAWEAEQAAVRTRRTVGGESGIQSRASSSR